eukprot:Partr_v1_DN25890_c1_g1_i5_m2624 putative Sorting and assembly machinery component 50
MQLDAPQALDLRVDKIEINGIKFTKSWLLEREMQSLMRACTLREIVDEITAVSFRLSQLGVFKSMNAHIEASDNDSGPLRSGNPLMALLGSHKHLQVDNNPVKVKSVNVIFDMTEKPRLNLRSGTEIGSNEGSVYSALTLRNVFGTGEQLECSFSRGFITNSAYRILFTKPIDADPYRVASLLVRKDEENWTESCSHFLQTSAVTAEFKFLPLNVLKGFHHEFGATVSTKSMCKFVDDASVQIRDLGREFSKVSMHYRFFRDTRDIDSTFVGSSGHFFRFESELGHSLSHSLQFLKSDASSQTVHALSHSSALVSSLKFGYAESIGSDSLPFAERFHMGGPLDIRGFKIRGIGPRAPALYGQRGDALGGNAYAAFGLSLFTPVPFLGRFPSLKLHAFYNSGFLANDVKVSELERTISNSVFSQTVGMGVCLKTDMCRVEANYVHPISFSRSDQLAGRFQLGVGIDFL